VEVCALSALCAIRVVFLGVGGGFPVDKAKFQQLLESEVDSFFAYVAMKERPDLHSA
jgi:hypothetical protein